MSAVVGRSRTVLRWVAAVALARRVAVLLLCHSPSVLMSGVRMSAARDVAAMRTAAAGMVVVDDLDMRSTGVVVDMGSAPEGKAAA